jgi:hypothetical protein
MTDQEQATALVQRQAARYREQIEGRVRAAWANGGPRAAKPRGRNDRGGYRYSVTSRDGSRVYTVNVDGFDVGNVACDCPAGQHGTFCWHGAAVLLRLLANREAKRLRSAS